MLGGTTSSTRPRRSAWDPRFATRGENHLERGAQTDQSGQPLASAGAGQESQPNLGKRQLGLRVIGRDAIVTGEGKLQSTAQTRAIDGRDDRLGKVGDPLQHLLPLAGEPLEFVPGGEPGELFDVGAGNEGVRLSGANHHRVAGRIAPDLLERRLELRLHGATQLVHRLAREIQGENGGGAGGR